jgi:ribosomal protein S18 acetylase RimI-like enzyme
MIVFKEAQFPDHTAIARLHAESWQQHYRGIWSDDFLNNEVYQFLLQKWHKKLKLPPANQHVIIALSGQQIAGFSCLLLDEDTGFGSLLDNLHVSWQLQKSGIGKILMRNCADIVCEKAQTHKMYLWVYEVNGNARNFYERLGGQKFETVETQNEDGTRAQACRYIWNDVSVIK